MEIYADCMCMMLEVLIAAIHTQLQVLLCICSIGSGRRDLPLTVLVVPKCSVIFYSGRARKLPSPNAFANINCPLGRSSLEWLLLLEYLPAFCQTKMYIHTKAEIE